MGGAGVRIAVLFNNAGGYSRNVLRGVTSFAASRPWQLSVEGVTDTDISLRIGGYAGVIVQATTRDLLTRLRRARCPVVNVSSAGPSHRLASVISDDLAIGRMGAEYFHRMGFRSFVYYWPDHRAFAEMRGKGFGEFCAGIGAQWTSAMGADELGAVLAASPKPVAVMGCNDRAGLGAIRVARQQGMRVPDDVAILGVDNDDLVQSIAFPPLSSINTARERIGFEAAQMLDRLMGGGAAGPERVAVPPIGVIARLSTSTLAIEDAEVAEAARYIHGNAVRHITVEDVVRPLAVSRRQLERRFRAVLGRSVHDEIVRVRLDQARRLLATTHLTLDQVSAACGFTTQSYFNVVFRKATGSTPGRYRASFGSRLLPDASQSKN